MEIFAYNPVYYSKVNNLTSFGNNQNTQSMGVENELPNPRLYADCGNYMVPYEKRQELSDEYRQKVFDVCFDENGKLDKRIVEFLDNAKFDIKTSDNGPKKSMTIKEAIDSSILRTGRAKGSFYHATFYKEIGDKIIKEGFDPMKISRTKFGPGFYFSPAEGGALMYSSCLLKADYDGNCAQVNGEFYERITQSTVNNEVKNFIGLKSNEYPLASTESEIVEKIINQYTRNYFVDELGIDMVYGSSRVESCYAVFNPEILSNIRFNN